MNRWKKIESTKELTERWERKVSMAVSQMMLFVARLGKERVTMRKSSFLVAQVKRGRAKNMPLRKPNTPRNTLTVQRTAAAMNMLTQTAKGQDRRLRAC